MWNRQGYSAPEILSLEQMSVATPAMWAGTSQRLLTTQTKRFDTQIKPFRSRETLTLVQDVDVSKFNGRIYSFKHGYFKYSSIYTSFYFRTSKCWCKMKQIWAFDHDPPLGGSAGEAGVHASSTLPYWYTSHHLHCNWPLREPGQLLLHRHCHRWVSPSRWRTSTWRILIYWRTNAEKSFWDTFQTSITQLIVIWKLLIMTKTVEMIRKNYWYH